MREQEQRDAERQSKAHERARAYVAASVAVTKQATRSKSDCDAEINSLRS